MDEQAVIAAIDPDKDVDGFHVINAGRLAVGDRGFVPCTPLGCMMLLTDRLGDLSGLEAVVIGRSNIVGKPMAQLLLDANATVTIAHSRTKDLPAVVRRADIVVAAVGRAEMVRAEWLKDGATVIDVGINRLPPEPGSDKGKLVGDVAFGEASAVAGAITPVPATKGWTCPKARSDARAGCHRCCADAGDCRMRRWAERSAQAETGGEPECCRRDRTRLRPRGARRWAVEGVPQICR
jgi:methylenetetrahydrofolate dehydrogenase (NADP+)/methenyltetrahydrofolate cyclohydrolase